MPLVLLKLAKWLLGKGLVLALIGAVAVGVFALWIYLQQSYDSEGEQSRALSTLQEEAAEVYSELEQTHGRLVELGDEIEKNRRRIAAANEVIDYLDGLLNRIERFITMSAKERAESEAKLEEAKREKLAEENARKSLVKEQSDLRISRVSLSERARSLESEIALAESVATSYWGHLKDSWVKLRPYLIGALLAAILAPVLWKLFTFYIWAPVLSAAGPIRLVKESLPVPNLIGAGVSATIQLEEGNRLWVKESFLQASDESLKRKTRFVFDWSIPATCLAAGLVEMIEFSCKEGEGAVTVSPQRNAQTEVALIEVPSGGQMVVRPSSVAGIVSRAPEKTRIERRWRLFHPQAWLSFQFRYFVFHGPCSLVVTGIRGVRFEELQKTGEKGRRANQLATIGFTPDLAYGVVRAETFWSYFRSHNPLFDDVFRGRGAFLCQEISQEEASAAGRFWKTFWSGILKVLGV